MVKNNIELKGCSKNEHLFSLEEKLEEEYKLKNLLDKYNELLKKYELNDIIRVIDKTLNIGITKIYTDFNLIKLSKEDYLKIDDDLKKLLVKNIPLQYILGYTYFYNEKYIVNSNVLIPRFDTEILVDTACKLINENNIQSIVDLCTGSGCIGISISKNSNIDKVLLVDISSLALDLAKQNIKLNGQENKCSTVVSDIFNSTYFDNKKFDMLVSNPPYIKSSDLEKLDDEVKKEPKLALDGGDSGLIVYTKIFNECKKVLKDNSYILLEIGYNQKQDLINLINKYKYLEYIECLKDYSNNDRVIICRFHQI